MSENTPTPWAHREGILHEADDRWKCLPINSPYVEGAFEAGNDGHDVAVANAAFIVKAVNSHDALVAALKEAVSQLIPFHEDGDQPAISAAIDAGRAALASIKETV